MIALTQVQHPALDRIESHYVFMGPLLQPVQVPLDGFPSFQCIDYTAQLGVVCKLAEGALDAIICVTDKDVEENWSQDLTLRHTTSDQPPP